MAFVVFGLDMGLSGGVAALDNCTWAWPGVDWHGLFPRIFLCLRRGDFMGHPSFLSPFGAPHWSSTMVLGTGQGSLKQNGY